MTDLEKTYESLPDSIKERLLNFIVYRRCRDCGAEGPYITRPGHIDKYDCAACGKDDEIWT